jgi:hypothetical protein
METYLLTCTERGGKKCPELEGGPTTPRKTYYTDLSDSEWARIEPHLPVPNAPGRPRLYPLCKVLNALSSTLSVVAVPGGFCLTTSRPGRDRPSLLQDLAARRCLGAAKYGAAPAFAGVR